MGVWKRGARIAARRGLLAVAFVMACLGTAAEFVARKLGDWSERLRVD